MPGLGRRGQEEFGGAKATRERTLPGLGAFLWSQKRLWYQPSIPVLLLPPVRCQALRQQMQDKVQQGQIDIGSPASGFVSIPPCVR